MVDKEDIELVRTGYDAFVAGDMEWLNEHLHENVDARPAIDENEPSARIGGGLSARPDTETAGVYQRLCSRTLQLQGCFGESPQHGGVPMVVGSKDRPSEGPQVR